MKHFARWAGLAATFAATAASAAPPQRWQLNMTQGVTETARTAYEMHMIMLWICVAIGIVVFGAMFYAMFKFRKSKGAVPDTHWTHSSRMELLWTVIPVLILIVMAVPATRGLMLMTDTSKAEMTVKVTGYQWKWRYEIVDYQGQAQDVNFMSSLAMTSNRARILGSGLDPTKIENYLLEVDKPLVLPTDTKIRFLFTADDVIHAWWVPELGWKQDAIPGFVNEAWTNIEQAGMYRGQCTELCGKDHGFMPIVVQAVPKAEFAQWLAANSRSTPAATAVVAAKTR
ncbi:MAG TPA: cytochrome c oxidase subunit II [Candidatus Saccharimonadia bacterium]|nr:cytochrome c oxidase subunit II [Candidatus Saccharimonadia bacterium]